MKQRTIGNTGITVSALGLGCNNFGLRIDTEASRAVIHKALDLGITFWDTADVYGKRAARKPASASSSARGARIFFSPASSAARWTKQARCAVVHANTS